MEDQYGGTGEIGPRRLRNRGGPSQRDGAGRDAKGPRDLLEDGPRSHRARELEAPVEVHAAGADGYADVARQHRVGGEFEGVRVAFLSIPTEGCIAPVVLAEPVVKVVQPLSISILLSPPDLRHAISRGNRAYWSCSACCARPAQGGREAGFERFFEGLGDKKLGPDGMGSVCL